MRLSVNFSTRGRPEKLKRTIEVTLRNVSRNSTRLLVAIDDDDKATLDVLDTLPKDERVIYSIKPREDNRGAKTDRLLTEAPADVYAVGHDSSPILTPGFDTMILGAAFQFPDKIGVVGTRMANASFPAIQAVTQRWVDLAGYIYSHDYPFWFIDHELDDLARMTGRYIFVDVETENQSHPGKTNRLRDLHFWCNYFDMARFRRRALAHKIVDRCDMPTWQKNVIKTWCVPVEARSYWINETVRERADVIEEQRLVDTEPDEGYLRAFTKARKNIVEMQREIQILHEAA